MSGLRPPHESSTIVLVIGGPITRAGIPELCGRIRVLLEQSGARVVVCDVDALVDPDAVTIDALARLQLITQRYGRRLRVRYAGGALRNLLTLMGLDDIVQLDTLLRIAPKGQTEEREEGRSVEEEGDSTDPVS